MSPSERVHIHYLRPPDRVSVFEQDLVFDDGRVKITFARRIERDAPLVISGETALETGSDVVWFTFPGLWHDIARFHRADGAFTGVYANVLVPCEFEPGHVWRTTDLFLDLWIPASDLAGGEPSPAGRGGPSRPSGRTVPVVLDEDELAEAVEEGWVSSELARRASEEADRLVRDADAGRWPPHVVRDWTRERALEVISAGG